MDPDEDERARDRRYKTLVLGIGLPIVAVLMVTFVVLLGTGHYRF